MRTSEAREINSRMQNRKGMLLFSASEGAGALGALGGTQNKWDINRRNFCPIRQENSPGSATMADSSITHLFVRRNPIASSRTRGAAGVVSKQYHTRSTEATTKEAWTCPCRLSVQSLRCCSPRSKGFGASPPKLRLKKSSPHSCNAPESTSSLTSLAFIRTSRRSSSLLICSDWVWSDSFSAGVKNCSICRKSCWEGGSGPSKASLIPANKLPA
mmetsp:Transcript_80119/g.183565  ORF Transcript_80119/g.183565 Transcript_80119/m.183565 type:complete len:215 (-) Transcript_80119:176-820(-)